MDNDMCFWIEEISFGHSSGGSSGVGQPRPETIMKLIEKRKKFFFWIKFYAVFDVDQTRRPEIIEWCKENFTGKYSIVTTDRLVNLLSIIYIYKKSDVMAFKLRWL